MNAWLWMVEQRLVDALLRSPSFNRGVHGLHRRLHRWRHGIPPEELGGTKLAAPAPGHQPFLRLFWEELKNGHEPGPKNKK